VSAGIAKHEIDLHHEIVFVLVALSPSTKTWLLARILIISPKSSRAKLATRSLIPSSLHAALLARFDRLAPTREVWLIGAALGRQFSHALISAAAPILQQQVDDALGPLVSAELIFRRGTPPDAEYTFKHQLRTCSQRSGTTARCPYRQKIKTAARTGGYPRLAWRYWLSFVTLLSFTLAGLSGVCESVLHSMPDMARNFYTIPVWPGHERNLMSPYFAAHGRDGVAEGQGGFWIPGSGSRLELS
jgi:hypothetical protein